MIEGLFGQNSNCNCKMNMGNTSSCKVLVYLVILYVILNCGILNSGFDICNIQIDAANHKEFCSKSACGRQKRQGGVAV